MKPMKVTAGEFAPDVDEMIEKATNMEEMLIKVAELQDDSQLRNITGVEEAPMTHYWTNQQQPEDKIESMSKKNIGPQNVTMLDANPHQTGSTLAAHENTAGGIRKAKESKPDFFDADGDGNKTESMKDALKTKKKGKKIGIKKGAKKCPCGSGKMASACCGSDVKKGNMAEKDKYCMKNFGKKYSECSANQKAQCDRAHGPVKKAPMDALAALAGGGGGKPPMGGDMGGDDMGDMGGDDMGGDDDPQALADKIKGLVDKLAGGAGGGPDMGDMGGDMGGAPPMGGGGAPGPM
jgi:hypothetical protein